MPAATKTYTAEQVAAFMGVSKWAVYEAVRRGECPVPPIRWGRRLVWPAAAVDRLLDNGGGEQ
ncbi:MAG: helix-turn-helix domain-containing protein [Actinomycetota bacterium]|jgi:predicted DNA-binding transcriptional regulator AlpA|nr:helix-turn-helix domain-containing protein [Actinomycetota bacterium]